MQHKILLVDDEADLLHLLKDFFELEGFLVYTAESGQEALDLVSVNPDIMLLDINMPDIDGIEVCRKIRDFVSCPILFLTAKALESDRIQGLMVGGDDYIVKPFSIEELHARVIAHLRRQNRNQNPDKIKFVKEMVINYSSRKVYYKEQEIEFTKTEYEIIELLSLNPGRPYSKEDIYERLWGYDKDGDSAIITEHIRRIRTKFSKRSVENVVETVWGVGYRWIG